MSRIVLVVQQGFGARILLQTDILPALLNNNAEVCVLTSDSGTIEAYLKGRGLDAVRVIQMNMDVYAAKANRFVSKFFRRLRWFATPTRTSRDNFVMEWKDALSAGKILEVIVLGVTYVLKEMMCASSGFARVMIGLENMVDAPDGHTEFFEKEKPDVVVTTSIGCFDHDAYIMREARKHGCKVASYVLSWDNTSVRGLGVNLSDVIMVWSDVMKRELVDYHGLPGDAIKVIGVPHYDFYHRMKKESDKGHLRSELGLPDGKRVIFLATKSPHAFLCNTDIARVICENIEKGGLPEDCYLVVRLHPLYYKQKAGSDTAVEVERPEWEDLEKRFGASCLHLDYPRIIESGIGFFMPDPEIEKLASYLMCSNLVVNMFSTLNIEAGIFDVPTVNVAYEYDHKKPRGYKKERFNMRYDEVQTHNQRIVHSGGTEIARSEEELLVSVRRNLEDPGKYAEGRRRIVETECGGNPGRSGEDIAMAILEMGDSER